MVARFPRLLARLLVLIAFTACQESAAKSGEWHGGMETLPNGAERGRNQAVGMWGNDDGWSLLEEVRLGSMDAEGPELVGDVRGLQDHGCIFVLDSQAKEVRVFGAGGEHVRSFGPKEGGPGDGREGSTRRGTSTTWRSRGRRSAGSRHEARLSAARRGSAGLPVGAAHRRGRGGESLRDIFAPRGRYLGRVRSPFPVSPSTPFVVRGSTLPTATRDELVSPAWCGAHRGIRMIDLAPRTCFTGEDETFPNPLRTAPTVAGVAAAIDRSAALAPTLPYATTHGS